jgi:hypothetical protein
VNYGALTVAVAASIGCDIVAIVEVVLSVRYCFRRRVFWRVTVNAGLRK